MEKLKQHLRELIAGVIPGRENALVFGEGPMNPRLMLIGEAPDRLSVKRERTSIIFLNLQGCIAKKSTFPMW